MELLKIGEITVKPTKLNNTGAPYYSFSGSLDTNIYTDITSNKSWLVIGKTNYDYIFCREQIMGWTAARGFSGLTQEEKESASMTFSVSKSDRDRVHTEEEQMLGGQFNIRSIPTLVLFHKGKEVDRVSGAMNLQQLDQWTKQALSKI